MMKFGIIGYPLGHTFSPEYFNRKFADLGLKDIDYQAFQLESLYEFPGFLKSQTNLFGLNVTTPHKEEILKYLDEKSESVLQIRACNCIEFQNIEGNVKLIGHNTDCIGFEKSLLEVLNGRKPKAIILGNGGASKAAQYVLEKNAFDYLLVSRRTAKNTITYSQLSSEVISNSKLIINTTSLGMSPLIHSKPEIDYSSIGDGHLLFDMVYNPAITAFMLEGLKRNAKVENGLKMLHYQADAAWDIWRNSIF